MPIEVRTCISCMCPVKGPVKVTNRGDSVCDQCLVEENESFKIVLETENLMLFDDNTLFVAGRGQDIISISREEIDPLYWALKELRESKGEEV